MSIMKKLLITETQYNNLTKILSETRFDVMVNKTIKPGDVIRITYKNTTSNFKVIQNLNGQIIMDNIDAGSANINYRYFLTLTSLHGDDLTIRRVHKIKEPNKLKDVKTWKQLDVKDVTNIEVLRGGEVIDTADMKPSKEKINKDKVGTEDDTFKDGVSDLLAQIANSKEGQELVFSLTNGKTLKFYINAIGGHKLTVSLSDETPNPELNAWESFVFAINYTGEEGEDLYEKNKSLISTPDGGETMNFKVTGVNGERTKNITIRDIKHINIVNNTEEIEPEKGEPDAEAKRKEAEAARKKGEAVYNYIINDKELRKAFLHQPNFLGLIKVGDPVGVLPAEKILHRFFDKKTQIKFGENFDKFKYNNLVRFEVLDKDIEIPNLIKLSVGGDYKMIVKRSAIGVQAIRLVSTKDAKNQKPFEMEIISPIKGETDSYIVRILANDGVAMRKSEEGKIRIIQYKMN